MRLWLRTSIQELQSLLESLIRTITDRADALVLYMFLMMFPKRCMIMMCLPVSRVIIIAFREKDVIFAGYTHLQRAQPVLLSHWLLSYAWMLHQDYSRLDSLLSRMNVCPLGSGAIAGHPFDVDRESLARDLGFHSCSHNSMHAVSDRDFVADFLYWASLTGVHLSRMSEDLVIYSTKEFSFVTISDQFRYFFCCCCEDTKRKMRARSR